VVVRTYVVILAFGVVLPFVNILSSLFPCKQSNTHPTTFMITINTQIDWTPTNMSLDENVYNCGLFWASYLVFTMSLK
jgi:hypothetical protein